MIKNTMTSVAERISVVNVNTLSLQLNLTQLARFPNSTNKIRLATAEWLVLKMYTLTLRSVIPNVSEINRFASCQQWAEWVNTSWISTDTYEKQMPTIKESVAGCDSKRIFLRHKYILYIWQVLRARFNHAKPSDPYATSIQISLTSIFACVFEEVCDYAKIFRMKWIDSSVQYLCCTINADESLVTCMMDFAEQFGYLARNSKSVR